MSILTPVNDGFYSSGDLHFRSQPAADAYFAISSCFGVNIACRVLNYVAIFLKNIEQTVKVSLKALCGAGFFELCLYLKQLVYNV